MLEEGVRAGLDLLGIRANILAYCERDAYAATTLLARMESEAMESAPIWCGDIKEFPANYFRGVVDLITAGFPCQDLSVAGRRAGLDGSRSGLFYEILRVAADCGAPLVFLENVAGIVSAGAAVVDDAEGELTERAAARVMGELADRGWHAEWLHLRASDVGAAHRRERWFCLAWRRELGHAECPRRPQTAGRHEHTGCKSVAADESMADSLRPGRQQIARGASGDEGAHEGRATKTDHQPVGADAVVADTTASGSARIGGCRQKGTSECGTALADATRPRRQQIARGISGDAGAHEGRATQHGNEPVCIGADVDDPARIPVWKRTGWKRVFDIDQKMDNAEGERCRQGRAEHARHEGGCAVAEHGGALGLSDSKDREGGARL